VGGYDAECVVFVGGVAAVGFGELCCVCEVVCVEEEEEDESGVVVEWET